MSEGATDCHVEELDMGLYHGRFLVWGSSPADAAFLSLDGDGIAKFVNTLQADLRAAKALAELRRCEGDYHHCRHWYDGHPCCTCSTPGAGDVIEDGEEECRHAFEPGEAMDIDMFPVLPATMHKVFCARCGNEEPNPMHSKAGER